MYSLYYQAHINSAMSWFVTSALKSYEHIAFDRTIDVPNSIFEFFVSPSAESYFLEIMEHMQELGYVCDLKKVPNRLMEFDSVL
jgi:hypothetical protein